MTGGERKGDRETMDRLVKDQVQSGIKPQIAEEKARRAMLEADRRLQEQGKR